MRRQLTVAVCTFRRPALAAALRSIDQQTPVRADRILVVDNDDEPSAAPIVGAAAARMATPVEYIHAPARNIALARNRALALTPAPGLLAFLDDDECASADWLSALTGAMAPGIAAAFGPVRADYPPHAPRWMTTLRPHDQRPPLFHGHLVEGFTSNCVIDRGHPVMARLTFREDRGARQSEDSDYFRRGFREGARYRLAEDAVVAEAVPNTRLSGRWLLARRYRHGRSLGERLAEERKATGVVVSATAKALVCGGGALLCLPLPARRWAWFLRGALHTGVITGAVGARRADHLTRE